MGLMIWAALLLGIGLKINEFREGEGANSPGGSPALAFNYDLSSGSQFNLLWGGI